MRVFFVLTRGRGRLRLRSRLTAALLLSSPCCRGLSSVGPLSTYSLCASGELEVLLASFGQKKFRAAQIRTWVYDQGVTNFDDMLNLPASLRTKLKAAVPHEFSLELATELVSKKDGTIKRGYRLSDGATIESVLMRFDDGRNTACISSQAGCAMGCVFCATGQMGFIRQLNPVEILEQAARFDSLLKKDNQKLNRIVFMGMGEPLLNLKSVSESINLIKRDLNIGSRKITVSTVGIVPAFPKLAEMHPNVNFAISLHAANDKERSAMLPANRKYGGLDALMIGARDYFKTTGRRVTFEWALIYGENDSAQVARNLGDLLTKYNLKSHVNVIPLNPTKDYAGKPASAKNVNSFINVLQKEYDIPATVRLRRGIDINAGCGQLATELLKEQPLVPVAAS